MLRTAFARFIIVVVIVAGVAGCPERDAVVDAVGGAPGRQVEDARVRAKAAEDKIKKNADSAAAVGQE